jgi:Cellulase (glycosyl hydrolase family 5)
MNWSNTVYAIHDYSGYGFPASPEKYTGSEEQKTKLQQTFERKRQWMTDRRLPVWNGEWGPVYARKQYDGANADKINQTRLHILKDQLQIYDKVINQSVF